MIQRLLIWWRRRNPTRIRSPLRCRPHLVQTIRQSTQLLPKFQSSLLACGTTTLRWCSLVILAIDALLILHLVLQAMWYVIPAYYKTVIINVDILYCFNVQNRQILLIFLFWIVAELTQVVFDLLVFQLSLVVDLEGHGVLTDVVRESFVCRVELSLCSWVISQRSIVKLPLVNFLELRLAAWIVSMSILRRSLNNSFSLHKLRILVNPGFLRNLNNFLILP